MTIYEEAIRYVEKNHWSIIPIRNDGSKRPALGVGEVIPFRSRYATPDEIRRWFKDGVNYIGVVTGKLSNLSVIDVDGPAAPAVESPVSAKTAKGFHYYFKYSPEVANDVRILPDTDTRSEGGYVVCPPTPNYSWLNPDFDINSLPIFPIDLLRRDSPPVNGARRVNPPGWFGEAIKNLKEGNRNATFARLVGSLHHDAFLPSDIMALLSPLADSVSFSHVELAAVIESVTKYRTLAIVKPESIADFMKEIQPVEWLVPQLVAKKAVQFISGLPKTFKTWLALDLAIEMARGNGLWLGKFPVAAGRVLVVDQERFKGETQRRIGALLLTKGLTFEDLGDRLFVQCGSRVQLDKDESYRSFLSAIRALQPSLIILDSFATFHTANESNRDAIQPVLERLKQIRNEIGCTLLIVEHETKNVFTDRDNAAEPSAMYMVGSVGKSAAAEIVFTVRKNDFETCTLHTTMSTLSATLSGIVVTLKDINGGVRVAAEE